MFTKILIANRGEIAIRVIRACNEMGIATVAVYSKPDEESLHAAMADQAICVGGARAEDSYLNMDRILSAALATGAQAIHPGYGFLAENAEFARRCRQAGVVFIGPDADTIARLGDKAAARRLMAENGVPVTPGTGVLSTWEEAEPAAQALGYPVLVKASAGGGGKGIRLARGPQELRRALETAAGEAEKAFGDGRVYLEKYLDPVKHIEVQLLADEGGRVVCLGERECSIQRNNQKLLEESPAPGVRPETRRQLQRAAAKAAQAAGYTNAGTVEFLLDREGNFYFMEMNTRLQVEHPVSELVTGVDIVKWQIRVAAGVPLDLDQERIQVQGAAIECRVNALGAGKVEFLHIPGGPWVRFDTFLYQGYEIPPYYDAMLGKMIVYSSTREEAIRKMRAALSELIITGPRHNIEEQLAILRDEDFCRGDYDTGFTRRFA